MRLPEDLFHIARYTSAGSPRPFRRDNLRRMLPSHPGQPTVRIGRSEDTGADPAVIPIVLEELSFNGRAFESESAAVAEPPRVRVTWNGTAGLWAFGQGCPSCPRHEAQGAANPDSHPPELPVEGELLAGTRFSELSVLLLAAHRLTSRSVRHPFRQQGPGARG
jgi:hypothetical protein